MNYAAHKLALKHVSRWQRMFGKAKKTGEWGFLIGALSAPPWLRYKTWKRGASDAETSTIRDACKAARDDLLENEFEGEWAKLCYLRLTL